MKTAPCCGGGKNAMSHLSLAVENTVPFVRLQFGPIRNSIGLRTELQRGSCRRKDLNLPQDQCVLDLFLRKNSAFFLCLCFDLFEPELGDC
jgi:hypothetical protein